jgi:ATP-dependent Clp protease protease subunit
MHQSTTPRSNDDESTDAVILQKIPPYHCYESYDRITYTHFYISSEIQDPALYVDMIHRISTARENDVIFIHLNTPGGRLDTGIQLITAMKNSAAHIVTSVEGSVISLGTLIFLSGDELVVNDDCLMMFHDYSSGTGGKGNEQRAAIAAQHKWFHDLLLKVYVPFLTIEEVERITHGEDIWMSSPEIKSRLKRMMKILSEQAAAPKPPRRKKAATPEVVE